MRDRELIDKESIINIWTNIYANFKCLQYFSIFHIYIKLQIDL